MKNKRIINIFIILCLIAPMINTTNSQASCNHMWVLDKDLSYDATCTDDGRMWYDCSVCYEYKIETVPATGIHKWSDWKIGEREDCGHDGYEYRECEDCYKEERKEIKATGNHNWVLDEDLSEKPTCTSGGYDYYDCTTCGKWKHVEKTATGVHLWTEWKPDGYLCEDGKDTRYCTECYKEETRARAGDGSHLWSPWEVWENCDCINSGKQRRKCLNCYAEEFSEIPPNPELHNWSVWFSSEPATALKGGTEERECYSCHKIEVRETEKLKAEVTLSIKKKTIKRKKSFKIRLKQYTYGDEISKYVSSNKNVAHVSKDGKVIGKSKGKATITVKMKSGCKATCKVTVK